MGGGASTTSARRVPFKDFIKKQFDEILGPNAGSVLVLDELLRIEPPRGVPMEFAHLGTLWTLDLKKIGKFSLDDLYSYSKLCEEQQQFCTLHEMKAHMRAYGTLQLFNALMEEGGMIRCIDWFIQLLTENCRGVAPLPPNSVRKTPNPKDFIGVDAAYSLHKLLHVKEGQGMDAGGLLDLIHRTAESMGLMSLEEEWLDEFVPIVVLRALTEDFFGGLIDMLLGIGFNATPAAGVK